MGTKTSYLERAVKISTQPENCESDNWGDWINLCEDADKEIAKLRMAMREAREYIIGEEPDKADEILEKALGEAN